ncbi:dihydrodipicolinate synthase family protein [Actinospica durhamensis]|uniref:Dihydrodipicolinate synthase family protein n=1 Tax=Actinospica durhamensis TaxID=1508375 RepID=A0A941EKS4_9ACTN|nr:dihydrodipicolinate synthase family protein [Actinospica durhamensis]MBR7832173.1 dihydrodipicolinate synthase family protein [Actinospica durhamensis]
MASSRTVFAAAHVVADPAADQRPGAPAALDWDATLAFRHRLWSLGLGVADAMDTAQRGMGLDWAATKELIKRSGAEAESVGGLLCCGVGTDQLPATPDGAAFSLTEIGDAYEEQLDLVEGAGAQPVVMCSRALAAGARGAEDYAAVYARVLARAQRPVILHWLGDMFDPALRGYWGSADLDEAAEAVLGVIREHAGRIEGIKVSLLDADREVALRRALPEGVRLYTGDDFNFPELIAGDEQGFSHALLGVFDPLAAQAAAALARLDAGDVAGFRAVLDPLVPLARQIFAAPTPYYKTGVVFLAYLSGYQEHFRMVGGFESARDAAHLRTLFALAEQGGIFPDPQLAQRRLADLGLGGINGLKKEGTGD